MVRLLASTGSRALLEHTTYPRLGDVELQDAKDSSLLTQRGQGYIRRRRHLLRANLVCEVWIHGANVL